MIRINLIPLAQRPTRGWRIPPITPRRLALIVVGTLAVLTVIFSGWRFGQERALARMTTEWETLKSPKGEIDLYKSNVAMLERQAESLKRLRGTGLRWSPRLNVVSDALAPGVWFTKVTVMPLEGKAALKGKAAKKDKKKTPAAERVVRLTIVGTALVPQGAEPSPLGAMVQAIRHHSEFQKYYDSIEVKTVQRRKIHETEVMDFTVVLDTRDRSA